jgi:hypothetical protein
MNTLFLSFWSIALENFPEGNFRHRQISADDARQRIKEAQEAGAFQGVTQDDFLAPFHEKERENHQAFCDVLTSQFAIVLSLKDFCLEDQSEEGSSYVVSPLELAEIAVDESLMVLTCDYRMNETPESKGPQFSIDPSSVEFHLLEVL